MKINKLLTTSALVCASALYAVPALAQTPAPTPTPCPANDPTCTENAASSAAQSGSGGFGGDAPEPDKLNPQSEVELESGQSATDGDESQTITVTGSRIRRPNLDSAVPITSISVAELPNQGQASIGDSLNDLPSLRSTFSQQNSGRFIGTAGTNRLDLRGLGTSRTLVLVNNRRHVSSNPGNFEVDVNTIPQDLLERIDVVTGGSSAVYGSDAVAGVVNFVLKRDFDGVRLRGQGGISSRGDRRITSLGLTAGQNFAEGRGNAAISVEYTDADPLFNKQRDYLTGSFTGRNQFNTREVIVGEPTAGDAIPDSLFFRGVRNALISTGGITTANITAAQCADFRVSAAIRAARCTVNNQPRLFNFGQDGSLTESVCQVDFRVFGSNNCVGGQGSTLRETGQLAVGQDRYTANFLGHFDVSDALKFFIEAKYVYQEVLQEGQPSFINQGAFASTFGAGNGIRCDNAFITAQNRAVLQQAGRCLGTTAAALTAETVPVGRFNIDFGGRSELDKRHTYRIVAGLEGDFNEDWRYELSFNYGKFREKNTQRNNLVLFDQAGNLNGFLLASDAVRNPAGQIVCRVNADAVTTNDRPDCVPVNIFGNANASQAALDFINTTSFLKGRAAQYNALATVAGDLSQLFELPGGPVGFAIGGEYRRETAGQIADEFSASDATFFNAFAEFDPPALVVKEVFGELNIPLLKEIPGVEELSLSGAARYSDYNKGGGSAKNTFAYNLNAIYAPIPGLRFRANYSKSVRVPTLDDLFSPFTENFAQIADPCDVLFINNGTFRAANCAALGIPVGFVNTDARSSSTGFRSGGNPSLTEETGKSTTLGMVLTPRGLPGFSLTVDYFDIEVTNLIAVLGAQAIINNCVDQPTIDNPFCPLVFRDADFGFSDPATLSAGINFAKQLSRGVDVDLSYRRTFDNGHRLNLRGLATYTLKRSNFENPTDSKFENRILSEFGDPVFSGTASLGYGIGGFDLGYSLRYIGRQIVNFNAYETFFPLQGRPPTNPDQTDRVFYPDVFYHDARVQYKVNNNYRAFFGVDNIFDRKPPLGIQGTEGGSPFSSIGRYFYAGAQVDF